MADIREGFRYSDGHYWVELEEEGVVRVGLTDFGQALLGDVTAIVLPGEGDEVEAATGIGEVESEEEQGELICPVTGTVVEANASLEESPELLNEDPYGDGWLFMVQLEDPEELDSLMTAAEYEEFLENEFGEEEEDLEEEAF